MDQQGAWAGHGHSLFLVAGGPQPPALTAATANRQSACSLPTPEQQGPDHVPWRTLRRIRESGRTSPGGQWNGGDRCGWQREL